MNLKHWKNQGILIILLGLIVLFMIGCPNTLIDKIKEEVAVVVTPPSILSIYPESGSISIPVDMDDILITFTKAIDSSSVNNSTFTTKDSDGNVVSGTYSVSNDTIAFNPSSSLSYNTMFTITAKSAILDVDGNPMSDEFSWTFTTEDAPAGAIPGIDAFRINYGKSATNTSELTLDISASNAIGFSGDLEFHYREQGNTDWSDWILLEEGFGNASGVSIEVSSGVPETYTFEAEVRNSQGSFSLMGVDEIYFEEESPTVLATAPEQDSDDYPSNSGIASITFSEAMDPNTISAGSSGSFYLMNGSTRIDGISVMYIESDPNHIYPDNTALLTGFELAQGVGYVAFLEASATDIAGNYLGSDFSWFFRTGDAIDNEPPEGSIFLDTANLNHPTVTATNNVSALFAISASDVYNAPYGMKIWGDNNLLALPGFEDAAEWESYSTSKAWTLSSGDGYKYIYYKFMDSASNESLTPMRLKISLDGTPPEVTGVSIDDGAVYTNNSERKVLVSVDAYDGTSGLNQMRISFDGTFDTEVWEDWTPSKEVILSEVDDIKYVYIQVSDFVNLISAIDGFSLDQITLDLTPPDISFVATDFLEVSIPTLQTGTYSDDNFTLPSYQWEMVSGPGSITFSDSSVEIPGVSADTDGSYVLKVTVTDDAENNSFGTIPFIWDTTAPSSAPVVIVNSYYSPSNQPEWSWTALAGADYYKVSFADTPDWSILDPDGNPGYIETTSTSFSPSFGLLDGEKILKVKGYDNAGNSTNVGSESIFVDTNFPTILNDGNYFLKNGSFPVDNTANVTDLSGSGIASVLWAKYSGSGILSFSADNALITNISANTDDYYTISLTVTDNAGNESVAYYGLEWDTVGPTSPIISAPPATPDSTPTWNWESSGDGVGIYQYEFIDRIGTSTGLVDIGGGLFFTAPEQSAGFYSLTLKLRDQDAAGNWSSFSTHIIDVDTENINPPYITSDSITNDSTPTWSWTTGTGGDPTEIYQWALDNPIDWSTDTSQTSHTPGSSLIHGVHTLYVREYYNSLWGDSSSKMINVDLQPPNPTAIVMTQTGTSENTTKDTTPNFTWTTGGNGGSGIYQYRYSLNNGSTYSGWSSEITSTTYTYLTTLSDADTFNLQVQERDQAGNWSSPTTKAITIDTAPPLSPGIIINSGASYTNNANVSLSISGGIGTDQMRFYNSGWTDYESYNSSKSITVPTGDGSKRVYVRLKDEAGNESTYPYDTITLDQTAPVINSFNINSNGVSTTSSYVTLNSSITDTTPVTMYVRNGDSGGYSGYTYSSARSWYLTSGYGTKRVEVYYVDAVGNTTYSTLTYDMIYYGQPNLYNTTKGDTTTGSLTVNYDAYPSEKGTNTYKIYTATSPTGGKTLRASTTGTVYTISLTPGVLYYVYISVENSVIGTQSDRYSNYMIAYSSNIAVIYNDDNPDDTNLAGQIRSLLEWTAFPSTYSPISGTMSDWEVTLVPEDEVSGSFTTIDDRYIIYGDPVIVTPGTTLYGSSNKTRNIIHRSANTGSALPSTSPSKAGVFAMGYGGARMLDTCETYWSSWGYPTTSLTTTTQYPTQIGYGESATMTSDARYMKQWTSGNSTWSYPLSSTSFAGGTTPTHDALVYISSTDQTRYSVYNSTGTNPLNGYIYGKDSSSSGNYYVVVRQGRFLQFGFNWLTDYTYTGKVYFINLINRMTSY